MTTAGEILTLTIEKPAAGGAMIARANGQVVFVSGSIPGETVRARIERAGKDVAHARVVSVIEPSPHRRETPGDPSCGGCLYAHIAYPHQIEIKGHVVADAFARIARAPLRSAVSVAGSPETGYRMRARLHVRGAHVGFFREGTHEICDARATGQLLPAACDAIDRLASGLRSLPAHPIREVELAEDVSGLQRVVHLEAAGPIAARAAAGLVGEGLTGLTLAHPDGGLATLAGDPHVVDTLDIDGCPVVLRRHVLAFFQGNRHLLGALVQHVVGRIERGARVIDLYAGVGLFAVSAAAARDARVVAVEGDRHAARDLAANAGAAGGAVEPVHQPVEAFVRATPMRPDALIVDPPRSGMSREALAGAIELRARTVIYVSCDVATLARDARRLCDAGYAIEQVAAFDLFPNTPHVETVALFART